MQENILKWYPFKENSDVLEIYDESSIIEKLEKKVNLKKCGIQDLKLEGEYDYITLIGTYEYAPVIYDGEKPYSTFLKELKKHLKPNGKILLAIDNRLGIKYYVGAKNKHYNNIFEGVGSEIRHSKPNLLSKKELEKFINESEFNYYKFYYPLPDYNNTNSIFTDKFLPKSNHSKILYPVEYEEGSLILYNEINAIKQICDNGQFVNFTNSYLVEISDEQLENDVKFVNYNIFRKEEYSLILIMKENSVEKIPLNDKSFKHIRRIKEYIEELKSLGFNIVEEVKNDKIFGDFIDKQELDKKIVEQIKQGDIEQAYEEIQNWYNYIKERLQGESSEEDDAFEKYKIDVPAELKQKMQFIKKGYIDLSFENVFCQNGYTFYDQEWYIENIPLEFILYRAINNLYTYNNSKLENKVTKQEMLTKFNLQEFTDYFSELEKAIQAEILDEKAVNEYREKIKKYYRNLEKLDEKYNEDNKLQQMQNEYKALKDEKDIIEKKYNDLINEYNTSYGWKVIKTFRKILRKG